jgi:hypothetical protein
MDMNYIDDFAWIVKKNLFSLTGFWFDCVTSIPWSCFDLYEYLVRPPTVEDKLCTSCENCVLQHCSGDGPHSATVNPSTGNDNARVVRVLKIFRILRVVRVLKLVKFVT